MSKKKIVALIAVVLVVLSVAVALFGPATAGDSGGDDAIFVVRLSGPIQEGGSGGLFMGGGISPDFVRKRLEQAEESATVKAVVVRLDTGGGTVAASQEIAGIIDKFPKPIVVSMGDVAASGGYYIASQSDRIVAQPGTLTGSIGVIWNLVNFDGLLEKVGVKIEVVSSGKYKDMFVPGRLTSEKRQIIQDITDEAYAQFVEAVAKGRDLPRAEVGELATGQVYTGAQALELGLVDDLGGLEEAIEAAEMLAGIEDARIIEYEPSFFDLLFSGPGFSEVSSMLPGLLFGDDVALLRQLLTGISGPRYGG